MYRLRSFRRSVAQLSVGAVSGIALLAIAPAASAHEPVPTDHCTAAPNSVSGLYSFGHPCAHHDACYELHTDTRAGCDERFRREMLQACDAAHGSWSPRRPVCHGVADAYYVAVRLFGGSHYSTHDARTPMG
jgi:hypothetical protein